MTKCNVCGAPLPERDQLSFLCPQHVSLIPGDLLRRYVKAARAVQASRRKHGRAKSKLVDRLAACWREASAFAQSRRTSP